MDAVPVFDQKKPHVVFIPFITQSHIKCMLKLARLLHHRGLQVTFVNTESNHRLLFKHGGADGLDGLPGFQFKTITDGLPTNSNDETHPIQSSVIGAHLFDNFLDSFLDLVAGLEVPPTCIICDGCMSLVHAIDAAEKLKIPIMLSWPWAACGFMSFYLAKDLFEKGVIPLKDESYLTNGYTDLLIEVPGMEKVRLKDLPPSIFTTNIDDPMLHYWHLALAKNADKVPHMIIHTFDELEAPLIKHLKSMFSQVYTVGPQQLLLNNISKNETNKSNFKGHSLWKEETECIQWLESKELNSVVYVNFGSVEVMSIQDLIEFSWGLINSTHYFLLVIRPDLVDGKPMVLPQELKDAINKRGFIASWCSQEEVLNHPSVGGFLTHGGWGSVIESLTDGVPMVCRPFKNDQQVTCRQVCQEWEVGIQIEGDVKRDGVEKLVRELMEGLEGKKMRKKAMEWKKLAEIATNPNGSSYLNIEKLAKDITMLSRN